MLCFEIVDNDSMKPSWLAIQLKTEYPEQEDKPLPLFDWCFKSCDTQFGTLQNFTTLHVKFFKAYFEASYLIAEDKKPHTIGETLVCSFMVNMAGVIYRRQDGDKLKCVPLSEDTVGRCIEVLKV